MPRTSDEYVTQMRQALALSDPDVDTTVGTPARKIFDAVGEQLAEASIDQYLLTYQYDIDSKIESDLDDFVRLFGFTRFPAKRAQGMVIFERNSPAPETISIPRDTQLSTDGIAKIIVQTITPALLITGDMSIQVPVQAVQGGASGNVPANSIRLRLSSFDGITAFTNTQALTGGADKESDEQLRARFKGTIFRGMAGTEHMFLGIALDDEAVTQANVLGASKRFRETVEVVGGTATSSLPADNIRYVYPDSAVVGEDIDYGFILTPGVHYNFVDTIPPSITAIGTNLPDGVYDLEYEYVPTASRNDPENGITNRIDIYVNGVRSTEANEVVAFEDTRVFNNTVGSPLNRNNFRRADGVTPPVAGNFFVPFAFAPVIEPAVDEGTGDIITINGVDYAQDVHFWLANDITNNGGTPTSLSGIEIRSVANGSPLPNPPDGQAFNVNYLFNAVPRDISVAAKAWRLVTTDVRVHQATTVFLNLYLAIIYESGATPENVVPGIEQELERYIASIGFNGVVQVSDLIEVVGRVDGVDAMRFLTSADNATNYAIQQVTPDGVVIKTYDNGGTPKRAIDVVVGDDEHPVFNSVTIVAKAQNSFGAM